jgi:hypothetical protein
MITKYNKFKDDSFVESLLESKLEFSDRLNTLMRSIPENRIKDILNGLVNDGKDINLTQNFIDIGSSKEEITFIQDRRAQQIIGNELLRWKLSNDVGNRYLTFNKNSKGEYTNRVIFDVLGFNPDATPHDEPHGDEIGVILGETESRKVPGKIYCLFRWKRGSTELTAVVNKNVLIPNDDRYDQVWSLTRNPMRIGRLLRSLLAIAGETFTDKEIEDFVNLYKSSWDIMNDAFSKFDVVSGDKIAYWYSESKYENGGQSSLGNSCMSCVNSSYFDIYVENPEVCKLVILYGNRGGSMVNGKWSGSYIRGRALLWTTQEGDIFMDRIYYNHDVDVSLFKQYANRNGWWYKSSQDSDESFTAISGTKSKNVVYSVKLTYCEFDDYPYVDTLSYLNTNRKELSNDSSGADYTLRDTSGHRDSY